MYVGVALSSDANAKQPESLPVAVGAYVIVRVVLLPAETVKLLELEIVYSVLVPLHRVTPLTFSVRVPVFEIVTVSCRELPLVTFPKATGFGDAEMTDAELPDTLTLSGLRAVSFDVRAMQPDAAGERHPCGAPAFRSRPRARSGLCPRPRRCR